MLNGGVLRRRIPCIGPGRVRGACLGRGSRPADPSRPRTGAGPTRMRAKPEPFILPRAPRVFRAGSRVHVLRRVIAARGSEPRAPHPLPPTQARSAGGKRDLGQPAEEGGVRNPIIGAMPANLTPQYKLAEQRYREAAGYEEKLAALRVMMALLPKHKGTEKLQADLRHRIA